jgi:hypothetical protein
LAVGHEETAALPSVNRKFRIHPRHLAGHHARVVEGTSFEAAAVAYVEIETPPFEEASQVALLVRDLESGLEHCIRLDLATGETNSCA